MQKLIGLTTDTFARIMRGIAWIEQFSRNYTRSTTDSGNASSVTDSKGQIPSTFIGYVTEFAPDGTSPNVGSAGRYYVTSTLCYTGAGFGYASFKRHKDDDQRRWTVNAQNIAEIGNGGAASGPSQLLPGALVLVHKIFSNTGEPHYVFSAMPGPSRLMLPTNSLDMTNYTVNYQWFRDGGSATYDYQYLDQGTAVTTTLPSTSGWTSPISFRHHMVSDYIAPNGSVPAQFVQWNVSHSNTGTINQMTREANHIQVGEYVTLVTAVDFVGQKIKTRNCCVLYKSAESAWT